MSFDKAIADLIAAVNANTEAVKAQTVALSGAAPAASGKAASAEKAEEKSAETTTGRGRGRPRAGSSASSKADAYEAKYTQSEMQAAVNEVKNDFGTAEAKRLIKEVGGHDRLADVTDPKKIDDLYEAARKLIEGDSDDDGGDEDGL